jgi:hypothetical protein
VNVEVIVSLDEPAEVATQDQGSMDCSSFVCNLISLNAIDETDVAEYRLNQQAFKFNLKFSQMGGYEKEHRNLSRISENI